MLFGGRITAADKCNRDLSLQSLETSRVCLCWLCAFTARARAKNKSSPVVMYIFYFFINDGDVDDDVDWIGLRDLNCTQTLEDCTLCSAKEADKGGGRRGGGNMAEGLCEERTKGKRRICQLHRRAHKNREEISSRFVFLFWKSKRTTMMNSKFIENKPTNFDKSEMYTET